MPTLDLQVAANLDDVHEVESSGAVSDGYIYISHRASTFALIRSWAGHRWVSGSLPPLGAVITVCHGEVYIYDTNADDANGNWHFQKAASPAQFSLDAYDVTSRPRTTASASDIQDALGVGWHQTPSLVAALQELIGSY